MQQLAHLSFLRCHLSKVVAQTRPTCHAVLRSCGTMLVVVGMYHLRVEVAHEDEVVVIFDAGDEGGKRVEDALLRAQVFARVSGQVHAHDKQQGPSRVEHVASRCQACCSSCTCSWRWAL